MNDITFIIHKSLIALFKDKDWQLYGWLKQEEIYGVFIFKRNNN